MNETVKLVNPHQIAIELNRTRRAIVINLEKIGAVPELVAGRSHYYKPEAVMEKLKAQMRRENWNKRKETVSQPA